MKNESCRRQLIHVKGTIQAAEKAMEQLPQENDLHSPIGKKLTELRVAADIVLRLMEDQIRSQR